MLSPPSEGLSSREGSPRLEGSEQKLTCSTRGPSHTSWSPGWAAPPLLPLTCAEFVRSPSRGSTRVCRVLLGGREARACPY